METKQSESMKHEPIRVCEVVGNMNGGGVEQVIMNYYRHIDHNKVQFDFVVTENSTYIPRNEIEQLGGRIFIVPPYKHLKSFQKALYKLFSQHPEWHIIHSHMNSLSVFPLKQAAKAGIPVRIAHSHSTSGTGERVRNMAKAILKPYSTKYATDCWACSEHAGKWLFGKHDFEVVPNAIELQRFWFNADVRADARKELRLSDDDMVYGHVGRFMDQKNQMFLVKSFARVASHNDHAILLLVGLGENLDEAKEFVIDSGLVSQVHFLGQRQDVNRLYQAFDAFVFPSLYEGLGMVTIEAQASGLPVLMSDQVPDEAVIVKNSVKQLPLDDSNMWSNQMIQIVKRSDAERAALDRSLFDAYDIDKAAETLQQKYLSLYNA